MTDVAPAPVRSARQRLRQATAAAHARVDAVFGAADLSTRDGYCQFLVSQAAAFLPVERALERDGIASVLPDWSLRRRGDHLLADLAGLGLGAPEPIGALSFAGEAALLGGAYVLEGSRLGGAVLRRLVPSSLPTSFLGPAENGLWKALIVTLERVLQDEARVESAIEAAEMVFALFEGRRVSSVVSEP